MNVAPKPPSQARHNLPSVRSSQFTPGPVPVSTPRDPQQVVMAQAVSDAAPIAPKFRYDVVAAYGAQAHLARETEAIGKLLRAHGINTANWIAQSGFRLDPPDENYDVGPPLILRQEIVITISGARVAKRNLRKFLESLKKQVSPYYGAVNFSDLGKTLDLESHVHEKAVQSWKNIFNPNYNKVPEYMFDVGVPDTREAERPPFVKLSVINFPNDEDPKNHFSTSAAFELERNQRRLNAYGIQCSELKFEGPSSYTLQGASVRFTLDQACGFRYTVPEDVCLINPVPGPKHNAQKTKKETKAAAQFDVAEPVGEVSKTPRVDDTIAVETTRNEWLVHLSDETQNSQTIRYGSPFPEFSRGVSFTEKLRPGMEFLYNNKRPLPTTVTVRLLSFWTLKSQADQCTGGILTRPGPWSRVFGGKDRPRGVESKPRAYTNFAYCVEIEVPLDFIGSADRMVVNTDVLERTRDA